MASMVKIERAPQPNEVPLVRHMRLTLAYHPITDIRFGAKCLYTIIFIHSDAEPDAFGTNA